MDKPNSFIYENENVYLALDIYNYDTVFFDGVCERLRLIIEKKNLKSSDYYWSYNKAGVWIKSTVNYPKAKLLLKEEWVINNVPKMMNKVVKELYKYEEAPSILELTDEEKFKDVDGNILEIEVRGERNQNNCYFKVKNISSGFNMPNLQNILIKENTIYASIMHYKYFTVTKKNNLLFLNSKKTLFLTYNGVLKVLFSSRTGNAESFQSWAADKLFTIQLGTIESKQKLGTSLIGVNIPTTRKVFSANASETPLVYLFYIGQANELLQTDKYSDDDILCKYGCTKDFDRRCKEHEQKYQKEFNKDIELLCFSIIEQKYIHNAETEIKNYFIVNTIEYKNTKELVVIKKKTISQIKQIYKKIQDSYIGCYSEIYESNEQLKKDIVELNNIIKLKDKDIELKNKDIEINNEHNKNLLKDKDIEIKDKDIEINNEHNKHLLKDKDIEILQYKIKLLENIK